MFYKKMREVVKCFRKKSEKGLLIYTKIYKEKR